jgi:hypothetical protein
VGGSKLPPDAKPQTVSTHFWTDMKTIRLLISLLTFSFQICLFGQTTISFDGILINKVDSIPISFASIKLMETGQHASTDEKGKFNFIVSKKLTTFTLGISFIGCHRTVIHELSNQKLQTIFVDCPPINMKEILIEGMTPKEIVKKAVASIPLNFTDSSYFSFSFYREYKKVNGEFRNLIENQSVLMFKLTRSKNEILSQEALATRQLRRSNIYKTEIFDDCNFTDFMSQNPIYYLDKGSLNPRALNFYTFRFDTLLDLNNYIINYVCNDFSSETHGISDISGLTGESWESGKILINKNSFAIIKIERNSYRNKGYNYPKYNNFVLPDRKFTEEFYNGHLIAEYGPINGKYYLKKLLYEYTNVFFRTQTYIKAYTITDSFEWYSDSITRYVNQDLLNKFYLNPSLRIIKYNYNSSQWLKGLPDFYFANKDKVFADLAKDLPLETQFEKNGK